MTLETLQALQALAVLGPLLQLTQKQRDALVREAALRRLKTMGH